MFSNENRLNLSLIFWKSRREGGSFVLEIQTGGGLVLQENQVRGGGLKNDPIRQGVWIFSGIAHFRIIVSGAPS